MNVKELTNPASIVLGFGVAALATFTLCTAGYHLVQTGRYCVGSNTQANPVYATAEFIGCMNYVSQRKLGSWTFQPY